MQIKPWVRFKVIDLNAGKQYPSILVGIAEIAKKSGCLKDGEAIHHVFLFLSKLPKELIESIEI
ncbi:hypothetical protein Dfri01_20490 [Dyadobacter frigoris]|nr:hypothetical protein Dfri01_20490 [Dyadobacter frigoris]